MKIEINKDKVEISAMHAAIKSMDNVDPEFIAIIKKATKCRTGEITLSKETVKSNAAKWLRGEFDELEDLVPDFRSQVATRAIKISKPSKPKRQNKKGQFDIYDCESLAEVLKRIPEGISPEECTIYIDRHYGYYNDVDVEVTLNYSYLESDDELLERQREYGEKLTRYEYFHAKYGKDIVAEEECQAEKKRKTELAKIEKEKATLNKRKRELEKQLAKLS